MVLLMKHSQVEVRGGIFMITPKDSTYQRVIVAGANVFCFTCELREIIETLHLYEILPILEQVKSLIIFCDSLIALQAILNGGSCITEEICFRLFRLHELNKVCFLQWLLAHVGFTGNENADINWKKSLEI
ncbi:ribonuclease H [Trichonephila clavipes]|nr:ribonuclease H [Trichonephila clavipes]